MSKWNKLDLEICNSASLEIFKKQLISSDQTPVMSLTYITR